LETGNWKLEIRNPYSAFRNPHLLLTIPAFLLFLHLNTLGMKNFTIIVSIIFMSMVTYSQQPTSASLGNLKKLKKTETGLTIETSFGKAQVIVYNAGVVRIRIVKNEFGPDFSYAVIAEPGKTKFKVLETEGLITLITDSLRLDISTDPVRFKFLTTDNRIINQDDSFGTNWVGDEVTTYKKLQDGERFIGLGEKTGNLDRRGEAHTNWNTDNPGYQVDDDDLYSSFPFYIGIHHGLSYGIFFDNTYKSLFNFGASNDRFSSFGADAGEMNYYFIFGSNIRQLLNQYTMLTGRIHIPPIWALGFHQSRWSYYPDNEVLNLAQTFREKKIPIDVLHLDIHFMDAYKIFTWHPERFSKPAETLGKLQSMNIHTTVIVDPGIKVEKGYKAYEEGVKENYFIKYPDGQNYTAQVWPGWCHFPDFTKPVVRKWWGENFASLVNDGVEGFWTDMNEIASWGGGYTPSLVQFDWEGRFASYRQAKNVYGMQISRSTYEGTRMLLDGRRPFTLTRASYAGAQRYTAIWTGDNVASDAHMMLGCRLVNSLGITGMAFAGVDVGGFLGTASPNLFARWLTIGTFTPFFRVHKASNENQSEPWTYGEIVENISRNYISLRYRLLPYIYSAFAQAHQTGIPVNRTLVIDNAFDEKCWNTAYQQQFMFGPSIMVAPVESTKEITKVYLPRGDWYDYFTGRKYSGEQEILIECPLDKLPVFARGGSFIPMQTVVQSTAQLPSDTLFVHVYYGNEASTYNYYEDDGHTYSYENGNFLESEMSFNPETKKILIEALTSKSYSSKFKAYTLFLHGFEGVAGQLKVDGKSFKAKETRIDLYNSINPDDPLWFDSRKMEQNVLVIENIKANVKTEISW
jgi:alpha-glucosidase